LQKHIVIQRGRKPLDFSRLDPLAGHVSRSWHFLKVRQALWRELSGFPNGYGHYK